jgi:hypothetical protein
MMKMTANPEKHEVSLSAGKWGSERYQEVSFSKAGDILAMAQENVGGSFYIELPYSQVRYVLDLLKEWDKK